MTQIDLPPIQIKPGYILTIKAPDSDLDNLMIGIYHQADSPALEMLSTYELLSMQKNTMTVIRDSRTSDPNCYPVPMLQLFGMIKFLDFINDILLKRHQDHIS